MCPAQGGPVQGARAGGEAAGRAGARGGAAVGAAGAAGVGRVARGVVKVQVQDRLEPGEDGVTLVEKQLTEALGRLRSEEFPAIAGDHCKNCGFQAICPIKGAGTVLS